MCRKILALFLLVTLCVSLLMTLPAVSAMIPLEEVQQEDMSAPVMQARDFDERNVIVRLKGGGFSAKTADSFSAEMGLDTFLGLAVSSVETLSRPETGGMRLFSSGAQKGDLLLLQLKEAGEPQVLAAVDLLNANPQVLYAEPDYILKIESTVPNDPDYGKLYGMQQIGAPQAWDVTTGSAAVKVGILDTGIDLSHPDLVDNIWMNQAEIPGNGIDDDGNGYIDDVHGWNFVSNTPDVTDDHGHGTHVAGTIGARGNNGIGVAGVAWNVKLVPLKVLDQDGYGRNSYFIRALQYAKQSGITITNNSYGGGGYDRSFLETIEECGLLFVASAGNDGVDTDIAPHYPSSYESDLVVSVGACDENQEIAYFSNFGRRTVDLMAPGVSVLSCLPGGTYGKFSGTSMSAPHVTGAAALLLSKNPGLSPAQLKKQLMYQTDVLPQYAAKAVTEGRLNVYRAMNAYYFTPITGVSVKSTQVAMYPREIYVIQETLSPSTANNKAVTYVSSNPAAATVNQYGEVRSVGPGTTKITVSSVATPAEKAVVTVTVAGAARALSIPDAVLKEQVVNVLKNMIPRDSDRQGYYRTYTVQSSLYAEDLFYLFSLDVSYKGIRDMTGVAFMPNLFALNCAGNQVENLDVTALLRLRNLNCQANRLLYLDFSLTNAWNLLYCQYNYLDVSSAGTLRAKLDVLQNSNKKVRFLPQSEYTVPTGMTLSADKLTLNQKDTVLINVSFAPQTASPGELVWSSSDPSVATVSSLGTVTALSAGSVTVKAQLKNNAAVRAEISFTVTGGTTPPISFSDAALQAGVVQKLKSLDEKYQQYVEQSPLYPADMLLIREFSTAEKEIGSYDPLRYCYEMTQLIIYYGKALSLDLTGFTYLEHLDLHSSEIRHISIKNLTRLRAVYITGTKVRGLDVSGCSRLQTLDVSYNALYDIRLQGTQQLSSLDVRGNRLTVLDLSGAPALESVHCENNRLTRLDTTALVYLNSLYAQNNRLTGMQLNTAAPFRNFRCDNNYLNVEQDTLLKNALYQIGMKATGTYVVSPQKLLPPPEAFVPDETYFYLENQEVGAISGVGSMQGVTFSPADPSVALVDGQGRIYPVSSGYTTVSISYAQNPAVAFTISVMVKNLNMDGTGTKEHPFLLRNGYDLQWISRLTTDLIGDDLKRFLRANYRLEPQNGEYIDLSGMSLEPIAYGVYLTDYRGFQGVFDGNHKELRHLKIHKTVPYSMVPASMDPEGIGLFSFINGGEVRNLSITGADVKVSAKQNGKQPGFGILAGCARGAVIDGVRAEGSLSGDDKVGILGGLVGKAEGTKIKNSSSDVAMTGNKVVGGFAGSLEDCDVSNCFSLGDVNAFATAGGFAGTVLAGGNISGCYSMGDIHAESTAGGFAGEIKADAGAIEHCYAIGAAQAEACAGGFAAIAEAPTLRNNFAAGFADSATTVGGFVGETTLAEADFVQNYRYSDQQLEAPYNIYGTQITYARLTDPTYMRQLLGEQYEIDAQTCGYYPKLFYHGQTALLEHQPYVLIGWNYRQALSIIDGDITVPIGSRRILTVCRDPENPVAGSLIFSTNNPGVLSVNAETGEIRALRAGTAMVYVQAASDSSIIDKIVVVVSGTAPSFDVSPLVWQNGVALTALSQRFDANIKFSGGNSAAEAQALLLFAVLYDEGGNMIRYIPLEEQPVGSGQRVYSLSDIPKELLDGGASLRLFAWESLNQLKPLAKSAAYLIE